MGQGQGVRYALVLRAVRRQSAQVRISIVHSQLELPSRKRGAWEAWGSLPYRAMARRRHLGAKPQRHVTYTLPGTTPGTLAGPSYSVPERLGDPAPYDPISLGERHMSDNSGRGTTTPGSCGTYANVYDEARALYGPVVLVADIMVGGTQGCS